MRSCQETFQHIDPLLLQRVIKPHKTDQEGLGLSQASSQTLNTVRGHRVLLEC